MIFFILSSIHTYEYYNHIYSHPLKKQLHSESINFYSDLKGIIYGFYPFWRGDKYDQLNTNLLTHIAIFGIELDENGNVLKRNGWPEDWEELINLKTQTKIHIVIICFSSYKIHKILSVDSIRKNTINTIIKEMNKGAQGVNIDFEFPYSTDRELFTSFIRELSDSVHQYSKEITVDLPGVNWNEKFDVFSLSLHTDGIVIMGYDYYYPSSKNTGPVAPLFGGNYNVSNSLDYYLNKAKGLEDKIIWGIPYYGYEWPSTDSTPHSKTKGRANAYIYSHCVDATESYGILWDSISLTPWYRYKSDSWKQCWFDDTSSLKYKYDYLQKKGIYNIGIWALSYDYDKNELWNLLEKYFTYSSINERSSKQRIIFIDTDSLRVFLNNGYVIYNRIGQKIKLSWISYSSGIYILKKDSLILKFILTK